MRSSAVRRVCRRLETNTRAGLAGECVRMAVDGRHTRITQHAADIGYFGKIITLFCKIITPFCKIITLFWKIITLFWNNIITLF